MTNFIITLPASSVSSFSGHNKYTTDEQRHGILIKYNKWYSKILDEKTIEKVVDSQPQNKIVNVINVLCDNDNEKKTMLEEINNQIHKSITVNSDIESKEIINEISNSELREACKNIVYPARGTNKEVTDLKMLEKKTLEPVSRSQEKLYRKKLLNFQLNDKNYSIIIIGRIDGKSEDTLIETKHRMNRLFNCIPIYEKVQVEMYFFLLGITKCKFIENFNGEQNIMYYEHSKHFLDEIKNNLVEYFQKLF